MEDMLQDPRWMPEITDSIKHVRFFPYTNILIIKFNL